MGGPVQGDEGLAGDRPPDPYLVTGQAVEVKGVERLVHFEHDVVGHVHQVVDGPLTGRKKPVPEPPGRGSRAHPAHQAGRVSGAEVRVEDGHLGQLVHGPALFRVAHLGEPQLGAQEGGDLPGQADEAGAVAPVGGQIDLQDMVVKVDELVDVEASLGLPVQLHDPAVVLAHPQLVLGQKHAEGLHPPDGGLFHFLAPGYPGLGQGQGGDETGADIGRAADDLDLFGPGIHQAEAQAVGVGVGLHAENPGGDDPLDPILIAWSDDRLQPGHGQAMGQLIGRDGDIDVLAQPG